MRPQSIIRFEQLYWASIVLSLIVSILGMDAIGEELAQEPGMAELGLGSGFVVGLVAIGLLISVLLWWLVARKASNVAKWILVVLTAIGLISLPGTLAGGLDLVTVISLLSYALSVAAIVCLFREDAKAWFAGSRGPDVAPLD